MEFRTKQTKHQVARQARPDAETFDKLFLIKRASALRATYQILFLADLASQRSKKLVIEVPKDCKIHSGLRELTKQLPKVVKIVRS